MTTALEKSEEFGSEHMFRRIHDNVIKLSHQGSIIVLVFDDECILKVGDRVYPSKEAAMRFVRDHTDVLVSGVYLGRYTASEGPCGEYHS